ncbi:MAG: integration host factor subunit alpha [Gammaproteobacteria bacterium]|nr:integration host factor subunit alpha [Gammaproteobacteria bacterium]
MTLTKADIIHALVEQHVLERNEVKRLVDCFFDTIKTKLEMGEEVKLSGFGNFKIRQKKARPARNPKTGEKAVVCARQVVTFHVGEKLKTLVEALDPAALPIAE